MVFGSRLRLFRGTGLTKDTLPPTASLPLALHISNVITHRNSLPPCLTFTLRNTNISPQRVLKDLRFLGHALINPLVAFHLIVKVGESELGYRGSKVWGRLRLEKFLQANHIQATRISRRKLQLGRLTKLGSK